VDIRELLYEEHSKKQAKHICDGIISGAAPLSTLLTLLYEGDMRMRQRVSWPLEFVAISREELFYPHMNEIIDLLQTSQEDSLLRNLYRSLQHMRFSEEHIGDVYEVSFAHLANPQCAVAIQVFAMTTCTNIAHVYPELAHEVIPTIESLYDTGSAGYKARAKKELKKLYKLIE
jgi:hypothetical protein